MSCAPPMAGRYDREHRSSSGAAPWRRAGAGRGRPAAPERALGYRPRKRILGALARCTCAPHSAPGAGSTRTALAGGGRPGPTVAAGPRPSGRGTCGAIGRFRTGAGGCGPGDCFLHARRAPAGRWAGAFAAHPCNGGDHAAAALACHGRGRTAAQHAGRAGAPGHHTGAAAPARACRAALARRAGAGGRGCCAGRGWPARPAAVAKLAGAPGCGADA